MAVVSAMRTVDDMNRAADYELNDTIFRVEYNNLVSVKADALVSSDDNLLSMGGGVSMALLRAGGPEIAREAQKHVPLKIGDVRVTSAGRLAAKFIFHAVTIDYDDLTIPSDDSIRAATLECLRLADALGARRLAFPALGTGVGCYPFQRAAETMTRTIADYILGTDTRLASVNIVLHACEQVRASDLNVFYERAVGLAAILAQGDRLKFLLTDLYRSVARIGDAGLLARIRQLETDVLQAQRAAATRGTPAVNVNDDPFLDGIAEMSQRAVGLDTWEPASSRWNDRQLDAEILRTKLHGLLTQQNIKQSHLNRYEIELAKYGGVGVPPRLAMSIEDLTKDMRELKGTITQTRQQLVRLAE